MKIAYDFIKDEAEKQFVKTVAMYLQRSEQQYRPLFTDFYNIDWMKSQIERYFMGISEESYSFFGGFEGAERQVMCLSPYEVAHEDYELSALKLTVRTGIGKALTHRDFLGAILGLGIERKLIGDIVVKPFGAYVIVQSNMADYILGQLSAIGRYQKLEAEKIAFKDLKIDQPKIKEIHTTVMSLRADAVAANCFGISRSECAKLIEGEKLRYNGVVAKVSTPLKEGDILTLRGYGKAKLASINGQTKKERIHITIEKYI